MTPKEIYVPSAISLTNEILNNVTQFFSTLSSIQAELEEGRDTKTSSVNAMSDIKNAVIKANEFVAQLDPEKFNKFLADTDRFVQSSNTTLSAIQVKRFNNLLKSLSESASSLNTLVGDKSRTGLLKKIEALSTSFNGMVQSNQYNVKELMISLRQITSDLVQLTNRMIDDPGFLTRRAPQPNPLN